MRLRLPGLGRRGATAVEYAILLPVFLTLILGIIDVSRVIWTQVTLDRAVEAAARCFSINAIVCGSAPATEAYAAAQAWGISVSPTVFTATAAPCGAQVSASLPFDLLIPWLARPSIRLQAGACYPA